MALGGLGGCGGGGGASHCVPAPRDLFFTVACLASRTSDLSGISRSVDRVVQDLLFFYLATKVSGGKSISVVYAPC